ncbi:MAG: DUF4384 domain-containing protein [Thermodesulfovibrionales bacterium]|nr:DUF4384 domain-containing protein [Thermodesulfovibrionales bacterium]MDP3112589.1 DUF4384 domain-containing protein [Thermodesulfovibrionales bacterium]
MARFDTVLMLSMLLASNLYAAQSTITEAEGYACMGEDKSKKQTEQTALADAKKKAIEQVSTYIKSETHVKNFELEKDLTSAYSNAAVKVIQEIEKGWYKDSSAGDCYKIKIKAEVIPDEKAIEKISKSSQTADDPSAPLSINVWTDKKEYKTGEKIKIYIKGNKPFYARVVYKDAGGNMVQLLPNPYRNDNYFNGGVVYEIPSGNDRFELDVSPPFGKENITVYSSTLPVGDINLKAEGGVYQITTKAKDIGSRTRGVALKEKGTDEGQKIPAEFSETDAVLKTEK